jgi:hypothetical protein
VRRGRRGRQGDDGSGGGNDERTALVMVALGGATTSGTMEQPVAGGDKTVATRTMTTMVQGVDIRSIGQWLQCLGGSEEALTPDVKDLEFPHPLPRSGTTCRCQPGGTTSAASIISLFSSRTTPFTRDCGWRGRSSQPAMLQVAVQRMQ